MSLNFYYVSPRYQEFLKEYCNQHMLFDKDRPRPFAGVVFTGKIDTQFLVPLTTIHNNKHIDLNEVVFINKNSSAINLNLMIPVPPSEQREIKIDKILNRETKYKLLRQFNEMNKKECEIKNKAQRMYYGCYLKQSEFASYKRCNDFKLLEDKSLEWEAEHPSGKNPKRNKTQNNSFVIDTKLNIKNENLTFVTRQKQNFESELEI